MPKISLSEQPADTGKAGLWVVPIHESDLMVS